MRMSRSVSKDHFIEKPPSLRLIPIILHNFATYSIYIVAVLPHYVSLGRRWETGGHWEMGRWEKTSARRRYGAPSISNQIKSIKTLENPSNMGVRVPSKRSPKQPL